MTDVPLFVNGEGMRGGKLHHNIEGYSFLGFARTAPRYRFYSVRDEFPALWPVKSGGVSIEGELYAVPLEVIRSRFLPEEPPELELGVLELEDSSSSLVMLLRGEARTSALGLTDISAYGDWRTYQGDIA